MVEENVLSWGPSELKELQEFICTICKSVESSDISQDTSQLIITRSNKWWYEQIGSMSNAFGKWGHVHSLPCFFLFLGALLADEMKWNEMKWHTYCTPEQQVQPRLLVRLTEKWNGTVHESKIIFFYYYLHGLDPSRNLQDTSSVGSLN